MNVTAVRRLLLETTFLPLFVGIVALFSAVDAGGGLTHTALKVGGAFLVAICSFRAYGELNLRPHGSYGSAAEEFPLDGRSD
jgi:hypothetical protein